MTLTDIDRSSICPHCKSRLGLERESARITWRIRVYHSYCPECRAMEISAHSYLTTLKKLVQREHRSKRYCPEASQCQPSHRNRDNCSSKLYAMQRTRPNEGRWRWRERQKALQEAIISRCFFKNFGGRSRSVMPTRQSRANPLATLSFLPRFLYLIPHIFIFHITPRGQPHTETHRHTRARAQN